MCRLCVDALKRDTISNEPPATDGSQEAMVTLRCRSEGEIAVLKHIGDLIVRTGSLYWHNEDIQQGRQQG
jgi:hypothetical protein